jgi:hypothetical protein
MYRKLVEAIVVGLIPIIKTRKIGETDGPRELERQGAFKLAAALLIHPGGDESSIYAKIHHAFRDVCQDWVHSQVGRERIVNAILA